MAIKVLIVDDSSFFQQHLRKLISSDSDFDVIDIAVNGKEAIEKVKRLKPDVITMDVKMPEMDGITAVRHIMKSCPTPILMLSAITVDGARSTFDALDAGAVDFLPKDTKFVSRNIEHGSMNLLDKLKTIAKVKFEQPVDVDPELKHKPVSKAPEVSFKKVEKYEVVLIGASTGGPVAVQEIIESLPQEFPVPIVLVQHMPEDFTKLFAERVNFSSSMVVKEAVNDEILKPGEVYIAPGGMQLNFKSYGNLVKLKIIEGDSSLYYRPCIDLAFKSAAAVFANKVLALVLTGMGADGKEGAIVLKDKGSTIWAQDKESSVVFGMPQAIINAGIASKTLNLKEISKRLLKEIK